MLQLPYLSSSDKGANVPQQVEFADPSMQEAVPSSPAHAPKQQGCLIKLELQTELTPLSPSIVRLKVGAVMHMALHTVRKVLI
jgi:hypothetical protein